MGGLSSKQRNKFTSLEDLFGSKLNTGVSLTLTSTLLPSGGVTAIYFSAHWCPPCRKFTPTFVEAYNTYDQTFVEGEGE